MTNNLYKKILIATDGSEQNRKAVEYGIDLAKISNGKVYPVYVVDTAAFSSIPMDSGWEMMYDLIKEEGREATHWVEKLAEDADIECEPTILEGHPSHEIINFAKNNDIDVIVMGTLGKSGLDKFLLGSVAEKVIRNSPAPVLVVRGEEKKE